MGGGLSVCGKVGLMVLLAGCAGAEQPAAAPTQGALSAPASRSQPKPDAGLPAAAAAAEAKPTAPLAPDAGPLERFPTTADGMFALAKRYASGSGVELDMAAAGSSAFVAAKMGQAEAASWLESKAAQSRTDTDMMLLYEHSARNAVVEKEEKESKELQRRREMERDAKAL